MPGGQTAQFQDVGREEQEEREPGRVRGEGRDRSDEQEEGAEGKAVEGTVLQTSIDGTTRTFSVTTPGAGPLTMQDEKVAYRNGYVQCVTSTIMGRTIQYSIMDGSLSAPASFGIGRGLGRLSPNL